MPSTSSLATLVGIALLPLFFACKKTPDKVISTNPSEFSAEEQAKIGGVFQEEIEHNPQVFKILSESEHPEAYGYVSTLLAAMVNTAPVEHRLDYGWTLTILHDDSLRTAFFLPGGHFYVFTGLLKYLETESQLLAVIGHELRYADTELMVKRMAAEFGGTKLGDILLDNPVPNLADMAAAMPYLTFEGDDVLEADSFAIELVCPFQYEPLGIKHVLEKAGGESLLWLDNRSAEMENRIQEIENQAIACGLPGVANEEGYRKFKERLP